MELGCGDLRNFNIFKKLNLKNIQLLIGSILKIKNLISASYLKNNLLKN